MCISSAHSAGIITWHWMKEKLLQSISHTNYPLWRTSIIRSQGNCPGHNIIINNNVYYIIITFSHNYTYVYMYCVGAILQSANIIIKIWRSDSICSLLSILITVAGRCLLIENLVFLHCWITFCTVSEMDVDKIDCERVKWRKITAEGLNLDYTILLPKVSADQVLRQLEETLEYFTGDLAKVK